LGVGVHAWRDLQSLPVVRITSRALVGATTGVVVSSAKRTGRQLAIRRHVSSLAAAVKQKIVEQITAESEETLG